MGFHVGRYTYNRPMDMRHGSLKRTSEWKPPEKWWGRKTFSFPFWRFGPSSVQVLSFRVNDLKVRSPQNLVKRLKSQGNPIKNR